MTASTRALIVKISTSSIAIVVVVVAMMWLSGVFRGGQVEPGVVAADRGRPATGPTTRVMRVIRPHEADVVGTVQAEFRTSIAARITANIVEIRKRAGDPVRKDEVLVVLFDRDYVTRVQQAEEALRSAEASRDLAKIEMDTRAELVAKHAASELELATWKARYKSGEADVARAQKQVEEAKIALADTQIRAPFDGVVIDRHAEEGEQASPGKALLTVYDPTRLRLEASVREAYIGYLQEQKSAGRKLVVQIDAIRDPTKSTRLATIEQIVPAADPASRSFLVKVSLPDTSDLYPGMFGRLRVPLDADDRLVVPPAAVERIGQLAFVDVVADGKLQRRAVRVGQTLSEGVEVLAGLSEGERVALAR